MVPPRACATKRIHNNNTTRSTPSLISSEKTTNTNPLNKIRIYDKNGLQVSSSFEKDGEEKKEEFLPDDDDIPLLIPQQPPIPVMTTAEQKQQEQLILGGVVPKSISNDNFVKNSIRNDLLSDYGPIFLVSSATAAVYTSVLNHPSSTSLTPLSFLYMILLAIQYAIQPKLSRKYIATTTSKTTVAFVEEITKSTIAAAIFLSQCCGPQQASGSSSSRLGFLSTTLLSSKLNNWTFLSSLTVAGIPAILYALQGVLQYKSHQYLDSITYNGLTQTKTLFAAVCCYLLLGKKQSPLQVVSLLVLFVSSLLFQGIIFRKTDTTTPTKDAALDAIANTATTTTTTLPTPTDTSTSQDDENDTTDTNNKQYTIFFWKGVVPCLFATFLSGLAGSYSQKGLQTVGRDAYLYTMEVSVYSALTLLLTLGINQIRSRVRNPKTFQRAQQRQQQDMATSNNKNSLFHGWTKETFIPIIVKAVGGILTALVHKHSGSVAKGFALMFGLVLSGCFQSMKLFSSSSSTEKQDSSSLKQNQLWGTILVLISGWMHFTHPPNTPTT